MKLIIDNAVITTDYEHGNLVIYISDPSGSELKEHQRLHSILEKYMEQKIKLTIEIED